MANLPELNEFTTGIYQIETSDPVLGGVDGITNVPLKALANRTKWLKAQVDALNLEIENAIDDAYVQAELNKLSYKAPVLAVTTTNITLSGLQTIDGVSLVAGNRVLVRAQSTGSQNGIWLAQTSAWVRADDMNADSEIQPGVAVVVSGGSIYADTIWTLTSDGTITVGTTAQTWRCLTEDTALLGNPTAPTAAPGTNTPQLATTAFVVGQAGTATPLADGTAAVGTATRFARDDHRHPTDATRAPLDSPAFVGVPTGPTAAPGTATTQLATCAFVAASSSPAPAAASETVAGVVELADATEAAAGTDNATVMTPLRTEQHMLANALGWGQTWQTFNSSQRITGTTYQNTTGRPIMVNVVTAGRGGDVFVGVTIGTLVRAAGAASDGAGDGNVRYTHSVIVPDNHFYRSEGGTINYWAELR